MRLDQAWRGVGAMLVLGALTAGACGGDSGRGGTVVISAAGDADVLFPPTLRQQQAREVTDLLFEKLAVIGPNLSTLGDAGWTPQLAERWEWARDSMSVTFHLNPRARWHDSVPVRAADVRFAFSVYTDRAVGASDGADIATVVDSMTVRDSLTCTAWFKLRSPERFHTLVYNLAPLPEHLLGAVPRDSLRTSPFTRQPVGNGPFRFTRWEPRQRIEITAVDGFYRGRANPDRVIWTIVPDGQTAAQRVFNGEADFIARLTPVEVADVTKHPDVRAIRVGNNAYGYLLFNLHDGASDRPHAILGDRALRRALTMAVDREAVVKNLLDSLGRVALGPFSRMQWSADSTLRQIAFHRADAARLLDSLGWRAGKDGVRARAGKPLAFSVLVPASSAIRQRLAVLLQEQWRQIGVKADVEQLEFTAMNTRTVSRRFDAVLMVLGTSPSPSGVRQAWSTAAITMANGFNLGRFSNPAVDAAIDSAVRATTIGAGRAHYRAAYQMLLDDAPAIWLFEPVVVAAANRRLSFGTLRDDAWWVSIPGWRVAAGSAPKNGGAVRQP